MASAAVVFVLATVAWQWDARTGFTGLIRFGENQVERQLPELRTLPIELVPNEGYDAQTYAQLAVSFDLDRPEVRAALASPAYRARRVLLPGIAHLAGFGDPWITLHVYALLNVAAWLALAWIWWRETPPDSPEGLARWCGGMLALGTLDSVRMALTDLPCTLLLVLAVSASRRASARSAAFWVALAALVRETGALGIFAIDRRASSKVQSRPDLRTWTLRVAAVLPLLAWVTWLSFRFPSESHEVAGNLGWPGVAWARHVFTCLREILSGNFDSRYTFGLIAALGLAWQSVFLLSRWRDGGAWVRCAAPFALLFWVLGDYVWHGYWAVARVCLPMTFAFVSVAPVRAPWWLANLSSVHGLYRMLP